jgi:hypothetical protein
MIFLATNKNFRVSDGCEKQQEMYHCKGGFRNAGVNGVCHWEEACPGDVKLDSSHFVQQPQLGQDFIFAT